MPRTINLSRQIKKQLPAELVEFLQTAGEVASSRGESLYLVGGVVRDLLLARGNLDLDLVVEGDAISLARRLADITGGKITTHARFNTAKLKWGAWSVDLAAARSETYERPGALPKVKPGSLASDLFRRDFTINAMAVVLGPARHGQLLDPYNGRGDLKDKLVRVLHEKSFIDDATRIWRGLRYEQRLDFQLEPETLKLLKRDIPRLETISGDRIRHELELILAEEYPEKVIRRAQELKVLPKIHPALKGDAWLSEKFTQARSTGLPPAQLYLALLAYRLTGGEMGELILRLKLPRSLARTLRDTGDLKARLEFLADPGLKPSRLFALLKDYLPAAIMANYLASDSRLVKGHVRLFLDKLRDIKPALTGHDLQKMGVPSGPRMKEILQRLHEARLDGKITSKKGEEELVRGWVDSENTLS